MERPRPVPPPSGVDRWTALLAYDGPARELLAQLKYRNRRAVVGWLAAGMAALVAGWVQDSGPYLLVTWAPTGAARLRTRGFDQAEVLAAALARRVGLTHAPTLMRLPGPPQTGRSRAERRHLPGFVVGRAPPPPRHVLLVDDVATTGATLSAAARALRTAGVQRVDAVVAGRRQ
jgi:predicted amidophosphoribosyltransferase